MFPIPKYVAYIGRTARSTTESTNHVKADKPPTFMQIGIKNGMHSASKEDKAGGGNGKMK